MSISKAEKSYIQTGLLSAPPRRQDGRSLLDFRSIALETGVVPLANGSARLLIADGTEILAATKLQVQDGPLPQLTCTVTCSPAAYPHLSPAALDDVQADLTALLNGTLSRHRPDNLTILPGKKAWALHLDIIVLADAGNVCDALFMAARAALWDTRVPRTRGVEYKARKDSGFDMQTAPPDFELADYWDDGEVLGGRDTWPVSITLNIESSVHYLDAILQEEASTPLRLLLMYSFPGPILQGMRTIGSGDLSLPQIKALLADGEKYALELMQALNAKLSEEDVRRNQKARDRFEQRY
ncbi:ribosomal protein S5 domain 2-like protein [Guyanagaster necrorhizus]|uniref:Ribosomal RNA-processing protein 42 n=1 Tax=Guyanagaster necrorhizus TaxID=856835 RepID=A0A9P7VQX5_9AGAR|nr:ribosomal protein S5 domain 2-like protein [Guyanagaster necrorhizus MCA 3950]KAG7445028.1 ribosomal protein S5 domain 2-like protein [Guyanagaster necrorhizus MCA 3950]